MRARRTARGRLSCGSSKTTTICATVGAKTLKRHNHRSHTCSFAASRSRELLALLTFAALAALTCTSQPTSSPAKASQPTTSTAAPNVATLRLEEEVEILARPSGRRLRQPNNSSRPHIYRVRASPQLNGRLSMPMHLLSPTAEESRSSRPDSQFGARAPRPTQNPTTRTPAEPCREEQGEHGSIAASSPTLRLTALERRPPLFVGPQPMPAAELEESVAESRDSGKQTAAASGRGTQSTLLGSRAPSSGVLRRLGSNVLGPLRLSEVSLLEGTEETEPTKGAESILSLIDDYDSKIITNRTKAQLSCDSGEMILRLNFSEPFKGIVYPDHNRLSACRFFGDGHLNYELRLPLRGCGTRQAAPRVFVNDVIVRFHKALELEEDEVKTLICRYPPPLAPSAQTIKTGNSLKTTSSSTTTDVESEQPQFELVDPQSGRPSRPEPGSSGNIETLSENLLVAPSGGLQNSQPAANQLESLATLGNPYGGGRSQSGGINRSQPTGDLFKQRNSALAEQTGNSASAASASGYFERLSSVELLFLISSLLFLILLALGLVGSLYCFRLRAGVGQNRASAILRRKRRYVGGVFDQVAAVPPSATLQHHYQQQLAAHLPTTAPSSPESDLSGRAGLLAGSSGSLANHQAYLINRGYLNTESVAHRHRPSRTDHYGSSAKQIGRSQQSASRRTQHQVAANQPVIGRREGHYAYGYGIGRTMRRSSPQRARHQHLHLRQPTYGPKAPDLSKSHEPLLTMGDQLGPSEHPLRPRPMRDRYGRPLTQQQQQRGGTLHRAQQVYVDHERSSHLWRAKSLSSFPQPFEAAAHNKSSSRYASKGGTVGHYRRRIEPPIESSERPQQRSRLTESGENSSDSDLSEVRRSNTFERNNNLEELLSREKPKIVLKSIEDSFITRLTEIEEQEYMKRDSTRPLDLASWRAMQPRASSADSDESVEGELDGLASAHTNLRSLTELDVNFVRTLPRPGTPGANRLALRPSLSADRLLAADEPEEAAATGTRRSNSVPDVNSAPSGGNGSEERAESPDLILSPEYDCSRLELELPVSPHNSVSYV